LSSSPSTTPDDLRPAYLGGLEDLVVHDEVALAAFSGRADDFIRKDALNHDVFAAALVQGLPAQRPLNVAIAGMSPVAEPLCRQLAALAGVNTCIVDGAYRTTATTIFGVPFFGRAEDVGAPIDVWLSTQLELRTPLLARCGEAESKADTGAPDVNVVDATTPAVALAYAALLAAHRRGLHDVLAENTRVGGSSLVVFVGQKVQYNQLRFSRALQQRGFRTVSVLFDPNLHEQQRGFFDDVIVTDLLSFLLWVNHAPAGLLHTQGWLFRYHVPALIEAFKQPAVAQICETMDLNSFWFPRPSVEAQLPVLRKVWGEDCRENHLVQCACEEAIFERADGVIFEGDEGHQRALGLASADLRLLNFPTYPLPAFFVDEPRARKNSERLALVFAAGVIPTGGRHVPEIFADAQWHRTAAHLLALGCDVHVYNNPGHGAPATYPYKYPEHLALAARYPHYRFEAGALPGAIAARIAGYDYGLMLYDFEGVIIGDEHFANMIPSKFFMYLEAGLPVLVSDRWRAVCDVVRAFDIGRAVTRAEYETLPALLATLDPETHRRNVRRAREALAIDRQVGRLMALYEEARTTAAKRTSATTRKNT
jgi:hypothetical protein